jgi:pimeloyl-ACP methyl ester carboxylesterase/N-acetylglutamate synthase-like GNAT family acetyltransferase
VTTRLVLLPGLGTIGRLFDPQRKAFPHLEVPTCFDPHRGESLPEYGRRMAASLASGPSDLVLGGVSFGGMVALEMARHLPARAVVLIASATSGQALTRVARALARAGRTLPAPALNPPRPLWPVAAWAFGTRTREERALLYDLIQTSRPDLVKWGLGAIVGWRPAAGPACAIRQIHGSNDRLIGARRVRAEVVVPGGGHLINVTHAAEVNAFLRLVTEGVALREAAVDDRERVRAFYIACGNSGLFAPSDRVLIAEAGGQIIGAVRLCVESGVQVLRTMRVRPDWQRQGIGRAVLRRFVTMLADEDCFCLPCPRLVGFYGEIGFEPVAPEALPPHLAARLAAYRRERPNVEVIAMRRPR